MQAAEPPISGNARQVKKFSVLSSELAGKAEREVLSSERKPKTQNLELRTQNFGPHLSRLS